MNNKGYMNNKYKDKILYYCSTLIVIVLIIIIIILFNNDNNNDNYSNDYNSSTTDIWINNWNNITRVLSTAGESDPYDELTEFRGDGECNIGNNEMTLSGRQPRLYVKLDMQNVEIEGEFMRIGDDGKNWSGMNCGVRSHPDGHSSEPEQAHTYYFRVMHDSTIDFNRELDHNDGIQVLIKKDYNWEKDKWYKYKFKCYNINNIVKLEGYIDNKLVLEYEDDNGLMYNSSGVVFIRNTEVDSYKYKNFTIKRINITK